MVGVGGAAVGEGTSVAVEVAVGGGRAGVSAMRVGVFCWLPVSMGREQAREARRRAKRESRRGEA